MTSSNINNVPRESLHRRVVGWFARCAKTFWAKRKPSHKSRRPKLPNSRLVELSPYLLRDIGFRDAHVQNRRK